MQLVEKVNITLILHKIIIVAIKTRRSGWSECRECREKAEGSTLYNILTFQAEYEIHCEVSSTFPLDVASSFGKCISRRLGIIFHLPHATPLAGGGASQLAAVCHGCMSILQAAGMNSFLLLASPDARSDSALFLICGKWQVQQFC